MTRSQQILVAALPYILSVAILVGIIQPQLEEVRGINAQLEEKNRQYEILAGKLKEKARVLEEKKKLHDQISKLRSSLPKDPELDILILDIERMSDESNTDLISIEPEESNQKTRAKEPDLMKSLMSEVEGNIPLPPLKTKDGADQKKKSNVAKQVEQEEQDNALGLKREVRRVYISGTWSELNSFLKRLEAYGRVVGVRDVTVAIAESQERSSQKSIAAEKGKAMDLEKPVMSFLLSIYYLP